MNGDWIYEKCVNCFFEVGGQCRKNPPSLYAIKISGEKICNAAKTAYISVIDTPACSEWKNKQ